VAGLIAPTPVAPRVIPPPAAGDEPQYGGRIRWVPQGSVGALDPLWTTAAVTRGIGFHVWDKLIGQDDFGVLQPDMLEKWEVDNDGKRFTFTLRDGLLWHDLTPVRVEDVIASIKRWGEVEPYAKFFNPLITRFDKIDNESFVIEVSEPTGLILAGLGKPGASQPIMVPEAQVVPATEQMTTFIGSGPYKMGAWEPGNRLFLERFEDYVPRTESPSYFAGAHMAYVDVLEMIEIPDQQTRVAAVLTGEVDYIDVVSGDFYDSLASGANVQVMIGKPGAQPIFNFNKAIPPFDNTPEGLLMRRAVQAATNAEEIMLGYGTRDLWSLCSSYMFCGGFWSQTDVAKGRYNMSNPDLAKQLIAEAGYDGTPIILLDPTDFPTIHPIPIVLREQLDRVGINVEYRAIDWATQITATRQEEGWNIAPTWYSSYILHPLNTQGLVTGKGTSGWWESPEMDAARQRMAEAIDSDEQLAASDAMQEIFFDQVPYVNLGQFFQLRAMNSDLKGYIAAPVGSPYLMNLWWDNEARRGKR
jgi:peptide/nickel transport system substrate-binding protein